MFEGLTWHFSTNVHTHSHTQPKAYIYAEVLSKKSISCDHLCNTAKAENLEFKNSLSEKLNIDDVQQDIIGK